MLPLAQLNFQQFRHVIWWLFTTVFPSSFFIKLKITPFYRNLIRLGLEYARTEATQQINKSTNTHTHININFIQKATPKSNNKFSCTVIVHRHTHIHLSEQWDLYFYCYTLTHTHMHTRHIFIPFHFDQACTGFDTFVFMFLVGNTPFRDGGSKSLEQDGI